MEHSTEERLATLEQLLRTQEAQIDGLVGALSDVLAAHAVLHKDIRLFSFLKEYRNGDREKAATGGTQRITASYFTARGEMFDRLLQEAADSIVFDHYWSRSFFWRQEEKQRRALESIRNAERAKSDS